MIEMDRDPYCFRSREKLRDIGIEGVLFDLDDTLIYTSEIFVRQMMEYSERVALQSSIPVEHVAKVLQEINDDEYKKMGVNPLRWQAVLEKLSKRFPGNEIVVVENLDILMRIYSTVPRMREGAKALLSVISESGVKVGLVTHANVDWTHFKLSALGLWDYFDTVKIVDENGHKKSEDWASAMGVLGVHPSNVLVIGDSLSGDIVAGDELGARTVWMPSPWSVYRQGSVPEGTVVINEIFEVLAALDRLR